METKALHPIAAFDICKGSVTPITGDWPEACADEGYRWLHLDLNDADSKIGLR